MASSKLTITSPQVFFLIPNAWSLKGIPGPWRLLGVIKGQGKVIRGILYKQGGERSNGHWQLKLTDHLIELQKMFGYCLTC